MAQATGTDALPHETVEHRVDMPLRLLWCALGYLAVLIAVFIAYNTSSGFRSELPRHFGEIPMGVAWFGATGAVIASLYGIFLHNQHWDSSYNYWHYCRPLFGAVTGSVGALFYLILLHLGSSGVTRVQDATFYAVAFVLGFADKSFLSLLANVVAVVVKPGGKAGR